MRIQGRVFTLASGITALLMLAGGLCGELTPEQTKTAEALLEQFSAPEFMVRQRAVEELIRMGPDVLPLVQKTLAETPDAEVKLRCEMVVKGLEERYPRQPLPGTADLRPPEKLTLKGKVVDVEGKPLSGVSVVAIEYVRHGGWVFEPKWRGKTAADGAFSLEVDANSKTIQVAAERPGLAVGWEDWHPVLPNQELCIRLFPACRLSGVVVNQDGAAVGKAEVRALLSRNGLGLSFTVCGSHSLESLTVQADGQGRFVFDNLPPYVWVTLLAKAPGYGEAYSYNQVGQSYPPWKTDVRMVLSAASGFSGTVVEAETGRSMADLTLSWGASGSPGGLQRFACKSGRDGSFQVTGLPAGDYQVAIAPSADGDVRWVAEPLVVSTHAGETENVTVRVRRPAVIDALVKDVVTGEPIEGVSVIARMSWEHAGTKYEHFGKAFSRRDGHALIPVWPGQCRSLFPIKPGYRRLAPSQGDRRVMEDGILQLELPLEPLRKVVGVVRDEAARPVEGAEVGSVLGMGAHVSTGPLGKFELMASPVRPVLGSLRVRPHVLARHRKRNLAAIVEISRDEEPLEITLRPGLILTGRVVDPEGEPISRARVSLSISVGNAGSREWDDPPITDAEGRYLIKAILPEHRYSVKTVTEGYGWNRTRIAPRGAPGEEVRLDDIVLKPADLSIRGVVVTELGDPVPGAAVDNRITPFPNNQPRVCAVADAQGRFSIVGVCEGTVWIRAYVPGKRMHGSTRVQAGDQDARIIVKER